MSDQEIKSYQNIVIKPPKDGEVVIEGEITAEVLGRRNKSLLADARKDFELPGFRKGNVPEKMFLESINRHAVLEDAAQAALNEAYPDILKDNDVAPISMPQVSITKLAEGNPVGFSLKVAVKPEVKLPNYKKIARRVLSEIKDATDTNPTDAELDLVIAQIQGMRAVQEKNEAGNEKPPAPPELTDEFVKSLGKFENVEDFKQKMRLNIKQEKEYAARSKTREKIAEALAKEAKIVLSPLVIDTEFYVARQDLDAQLKKVGVTLEDHLKQINKTEEEFIKDQRNHIERQIKTRLIFEGIAESENINPAPEEVAAQVGLLKTKHPDTHESQLAEYARTMLKNERVLELLEGKKERHQEKRAENT